MTLKWPVASLLFASLALAACEDGATGGGDAGADLAAPALPSVSAVARASGENVVSALVDVTTGHADTVVVEWGDSTQYGHQTPALPAPDGTQTITVVGLTPSATSHLRVTATSALGSSMSGDLTVAGGPLPSALPTWHVTTPSNAVTGYLMISLVRVADWQGWAEIVDREGRIVWYRRARGTAAPMVFDRLINGRYAFYQNDLLGTEEIDLSGKVYRLWTEPASVAPLGADGHEFLLLPNHNATMIGMDQHSVDTRPYFDGGIADANELHNSLDEIDPDGGVAFHWSTYPEITPGDLTPDVLPQSPTAPDISHGNAASVAPDGNYIYHVRAASQLIKLDRKTAAIIWKMGGKRGDFTFVNDSGNGFSHGHDFHYLANGNLACIDNGIEHKPAVTRALEYQIDEKAKTATLVWEYHHAPEIFSPLAGSIRRLPNDDTVVAYGQAGTITQVDKNKAVVWEIQQQPMMLAPDAGVPMLYVIYRAIPLASIYP